MPPYSNAYRPSLANIWRLKSSPEVWQQPTPGQHRAPGTEGSGLAAASSSSSSVWAGKAYSAAFTPSRVWAFLPFQVSEFWNLAASMIYEGTALQ